MYDIVLALSQGSCNVLWAFSGLSMRNSSRYLTLSISTLNNKLISVNISYFDLLVMCLALLDD